MIQYGLIGEKLTHSYSPQIHRALGDYDYQLLEIKPDQLATFFETTPFEGINVTIPYKQAALKYCDELSDSARTIGSVNTIKRLKDGRLYGDNTDVSGFLYLLKMGNIQVKNKKVLVLGNGGSRLTVVYALEKEQAAEVITVSRRGEVNYDNVYQHLDAQVIINTTPVGMYPNNGESPISLQSFKGLEGVVDLIYNPEQTALLMAAQQLGIPNIGGLPMLVAQAASASELFTGDRVAKTYIATLVKDIRDKHLNIVLVGMPGSGKTTIGTSLAQLTGRKLVDTDAEIVKKVGKSIPEIFETVGEVAFRTYETDVIKKVGASSGLVISTGGGAILNPENHAHLRQNAIVIFLERHLDQLDRSLRPLSGGSLKKMYDERLPIYKKIADVTVINNQSPPAVTQKVREAFYEIINR